MEHNVPRCHSRHSLCEQLRHFGWIRLFLSGLAHKGDYRVFQRQGLSRTRYFRGPTRPRSNICNLKSGKLLLPKCTSYSFISGSTIKYLHFNHSLPVVDGVRWRCSPTDKHHLTRTSTLKSKLSFIFLCCIIFQSSQ